MDDYKVNISEILDALMVIKNVCQHYDRCINCPFFSIDMCNIKNTDPENWNLDSNYTWRAFK